MKLTLDQAHLALHHALKKAQEMGLKMNIAIVDDATHLMAFSRMEGAWLGSIDIAIKKAKTARFFDMPTRLLGKMSQPGEPLYGIEITNQGLVSFPGGVLLMSGGEIVGAIGVSGATADQDEEVAKAGARGMESGQS